MLRQWSGTRPLRHVFWLALISTGSPSCFRPAIEQDATSPQDDADADPTEVSSCGECSALTGPCATGQCIAGQCVAVPVGDDTVCETSDLCTEGRCVGLTCVASPKDCSDSLTCSIDACDTATGACRHDLSMCTCATDKDCDNGDPCDGEERCLPHGICAEGIEVSCDPGPDLCKPILCDKIDGQCRATSAEDGTPCDDEDPCTDRSACSAGTCEGVMRRCEPSGPCEADGVCDATTGSCRPVFLADDAACTSDGNVGFCSVYQCIPRRILAGGSHTCVVDGPRLSCWGNGFLGQLGLGSIVKVGDNEHPADYGFLTFNEGLVDLSLGANHTCAVLADSRLRCWGEGAGYQHGYGHNGNVGDTQSATQLSNLPLPLVHRVAAGLDHTCALMSGSQGPRCWGRNTYGQLGQGNTSTIGGAEEAVDIVFPTPFIRLRAGPYTTCGIDNQARLWCWGQNTRGKLGLGHTRHIGDDEVPSSAGYVPLDGPVVDVGIGTSHVCVLLEGGRVRCWGAAPFLGLGRDSDLGDDEAVLSAPPVDLGGDVMGLGVGSFHTCALMTNGDVRCWGLNDFGQLGLGHTNGIGQPGSPSIVSVQLGESARQITSGSVHTCALLAHGDIKCWGRGRDGRLGLTSEDDIGDDEAPDTQPAVRWR